MNYVTVFLLLMDAFLVAWMGIEIGRDVHPESSSERSAKKIDR